jgi:hypothetical protein
MPQTARCRCLWAAEAIVRIVATRYGKRSFRAHVDPSRDGCEAVNGAADALARNCFDASAWLIC